MYSSRYKFGSAILLLIASASINSVQLAQAKEAAVPKYDSETESVIRQGFIRNASLSQLHRQWTYYESEKIDSSILLDTLGDDVVVTTPAGTTEGVSAFNDFITKSKPNYANGHSLVKVDIAVDDSGKTTMQATANYVVAPAEAGGETKAHVLEYSASLSPMAAEPLPKFSEIIIGLGSVSNSEPLENAYANNRMRSLVHYYNSLIENPARDAEPFRELFASKFNIDFGNGKPMNSFEQFEGWIATAASSVSASSHTVDSFSVTAVGDNEYKLSVDFSWKGILPNGIGLAGKTHHDWLVQDDPAERFARIKDIVVSFIEPIGPIKN